MRRTAWISLLGLLLALPSPAGAEPPAPVDHRSSIGPAAGDGLGPSPTGCPAFWNLQNTAGTLTGSLEIDDVGPFGNTNLRLSGAGMELRDGALTATIRVKDMRRQVTPGFTQSGWQLGFFMQPGNRFVTMTGLYHLASDAFTFHARSGGNLVAATGEVLPGPDGGVRVTVPVESLGVEADTTVAADGYVKTFALLHYVHMANPESGISTDHHWSKLPTPIPVAACPGAVIEDAHPLVGGAQVTGLTLPLRAGNEVTVERFMAGGWEPVGSSNTDEDGWFLVRATLPAGPSTIRVRVDTPLAGTGHSSSVTVSPR